MVVCEAYAALALSAQVLIATLMPLILPLGLKTRLGVDMRTCSVRKGRGRFFWTHIQQT